MVLARRIADIWSMYGYTVQEVARFLQYDEQAIRYWLRTGHLNGRFDHHLGDWRVTPGDLVVFLRQTSEPMPTGVVTQSLESLPASPVPVSPSVPNDIVFSSDAVKVSRPSLAVAERVA